VKENDGKLVTKIFDMSRGLSCLKFVGKGVVQQIRGAEYKQHLIDIQVLMAKVPQQLRCLRSTCDHYLVIDLIIENLVEDSKLEAAHTVMLALRSGKTKAGS
jgi:hypothetical protein